MIVPEADKNLIGVYKIESPSGKTYVGMTCDSFSGRLSGHIKYLKNGGHHCKGLQRAYVKYGLENLKFTVLEKWEKPHTSEMEALGSKILAREALWWRKIRSEGTLMYNGEPSGTGSVFHTEETKLRIAMGQLKFVGVNEVPINLRDQICVQCGNVFHMPIVRKTCSDECYSARISTVGESQALDIPPRDLVGKLWLNQELTVIECQEILDIRTGRFYKILDHYNLPRRPNFWVPKRDMPDRDYLVRLYTNEQRTIKEITNLVGLSEKKLNFVRKFYSIPQRGRIKRTMMLQTL